MEAVDFATEFLCVLSVRNVSMNGVILGAVAVKPSERILQKSCLLNLVGRRIKMTKNKMVDPKLPDLISILALVGIIATAAIVIPSWIKQIAEVVINLPHCP